MAIDRAAYKRVWNRTPSGIRSRLKHNNSEQGHRTRARFHDIKDDKIAVNSVILSGKYQYHTMFPHLIEDLDYDIDDVITALTQHPPTVNQKYSLEQVHFAFMRNYGQE